MSDQREVITVIEPRGSWHHIGLREVWEYKHLLVFMVLRAIRGRYRPTLLGYGWIVLRPALLSLVYVLVVGQLFEVDSGTVPFPLFVYLGVVVYLFFSSGSMDVATSLIGNASTMSKVYYPRLIIPISSILANFLDWMGALVVVALMMLIYRIVPAVQMLLLPLFVLGIVGITFGLGLLLAARTVRTRDVLLVMPALMRVLIYTMPAVYPISRVPERFQTLYYLNPMSALLQGLRWSVWGEAAPPAWSLAAATGTTVALVYIGLRAFAAVERSMVDTL